MNILRTITSKIASVPKVVKSTVLVAATLAFVSGVVYAGWSPDRPVYDWNKPADQIGSMNGPVFNSFINTPYYGDERAFFDARMSNSNDTKDVLPYVTTGTREVILRTYVHNNANQSTNASGLGVAKGAKVRIDLPTGTNTALRMRSYISATNATEVTDTAELVDSQAFAISYIPGSAKMYNSANANGAALADSIVTTGANIGYNTPNGEVPGCFQYQTFVEIHVKIQVPEVTILKEVKSPTDTAWKKESTVKPGETVKWMVTVRNTGSVRLDETTATDALPPHMTVVPGSVKRTDGANNSVVQNDSALFTTGGINFKSYAPAAALYIRFDAVAKGDFDGCEVRVRNQAFVKSTQTPTDKKDTADLIIKKDNCTPPVKIVTCDALTAPKYTLKTGESTVFTASGTATNTTISGYIFTVNGTVVQDSAANSYTFVQNSNGTYNVAVTVKSPIGNVTSQSCAKTVDVTTEVTPIYRCEALTLSKTTVKVGEKVKTTVRFTAKDGATFKQATFKFGDSTTFTTNNASGDIVETEHAYAAKGTYGIQVKLDFNVNGQTKSVEGGNCVGQVTVVTEKCTIPGKEQYEKDDKVNCNDVKGVTTIPDTGAGNVIGIFAGVTAAGAFMHNMLARRSVRK